MFVPTDGVENADPSDPGGKEGSAVGDGFSVVRVGRQDKIHPDIRCISLDELVKKRLRKGK